MSSRSVRVRSGSGSERGAVADALGFVQPDRGLAERVVDGVADAADRRLQPGQPSASHRGVLRCTECIAGVLPASEWWIASSNGGPERGRPRPAGSRVRRTPFDSTASSPSPGSTRRRRRPRTRCSRTRWWPSANRPPTRVSCQAATGFACWFGVARRRCRLRAGCLPGKLVGEFARRWSGRRRIGVCHSVRGRPGIWTAGPLRPGRRGRRGRQHGRRCLVFEVRNRLQRLWR